jgi:alpha-L-fucosidase 2
MYGVYPGHMISPYRTVTLANAARMSLNYRGDYQGGWPAAWRICLWARLQNASRAYDFIKGLIKLSNSPKTPSKRGTAVNMFNVRPEFQIDGNLGAIGGIAEMLLQSHDTAMHILPALPDHWKEGKVTGLRARGGFTLVSLEWSEGKVKKMRIRSNLGGNLRLRVYAPIKCLDGTLKPATGDNPNEFYRYAWIQGPGVNEERMNTENGNDVFEYDLDTGLAEEYRFVPA